MRELIDTIEAHIEGLEHESDWLAVLLVRMEDNGLQDTFLYAGTELRRAWVKLRIELWSWVVRQMSNAREWLRGGE